MEVIVKQPRNIIQDTRNYIINTARRFFSEYSYSSVSMNDIAKKLNITKAALYYHFTGKAEIYEEVINIVFNDLNFVLTKISKSNESANGKKLQKMIKNYLDFGINEKNIIKAVVLKLPSEDDKVQKHIVKLRKKIIDIIQSVVEETLKSKNLTKKIDSRSLTSLLHNIMDGALLESYLLDNKINSTKISNKVVSILF